MTDDSDTREKLRAAILTFVMVTSVFGATVAFSGTAAANGQVTTSPFDVQAGAVDQAGGGDSLTFDGGGNGFSSSSGTATFRLPAGSDVTFDQQNSSLAISTSGLSASNLRFQSNRAIAIDLSGAGSSDSITVSGIRYKAAPTTGITETITATFGSDTGTTTVSTVGLSTALDSTSLTRGSEGVGTAQLAIEAESAADTDKDGQSDDSALASGNTQPFAASGDNITVSIDGQNADQLSFDTSSSVSLDTSSSDFGSSDVGPIVFADEDTLTFQLNTDFNNDDQLELDGIAYNTTGVSDDTVNPEFSSALNVTTTPKFATESVTVQTASNVNVESPTVRFTDGGNGGDAEDEGSNGLSPGTDQQPSPQDTNGNNVVVEIEDDGNADNEIATGTVTISVPSDSGITFDTSQVVEVDYGDNNLEVANNGVGNGVARSDTGDVSVSSTQISFDVTAASGSADDVIHVGSDDTSDDNPAGGGLAANSLKFNVTDDSSASDVNLTVTTPGGAATVVQNTSDGDGEGSSYDLDVRPPTLVTNDGDNQGNNGGNDLQLGNDADGETEIGPNNNDNDLVFQSEVTDDILDGSGNNITVTIPESAAFTFDQSEDNTGNLDILGGADHSDGSLPGTDTSVGNADNGNLGDDEVTIVDDRTLNLTFDAEAVDQGDDLYVTGIQYNTTAGESSSTRLQATSSISPDVNVQSENFINVTVAEADTIQSDADQGTTFGSTGSNAATVGVAVGNSQVSTLKVTNSSGVGDNSLTDLGSADVNLAVTDSPDGGSASDVSLNTTTATTAADGTVDYNTTVADSAAVGTYNVTASLASNASVNVTTQYSVTAGQASQFNVTAVDNAVIDESGLSGSPGETEEAAYSVRIEDSGGNPVSDSTVDVNIDVSGGDLQAVNSQIANDGTPAGNQVTDADNNDRRDYDASNGGTHDGEGTEGQFFVFVSSSSPGNVDVTVSEGGVSDTGTATVFDSANQTAITLNESSVTAGDNVAVEAVAQTSDGTTIEVPRLTVGSITSNNATVATLSNVDSNTNDTGVATATATAQANGTTQINATIAGNQASTTLTTGSGSPLEGTAGQFDDDGDGDITAAELGGAVDQFGAGDLTAAELGEVVDAFAQS